MRKKYIKAFGNQKEGYKNHRDVISWGINIFCLTDVEYVSGGCFNVDLD